MNLIFGMMACLTVSYDTTKNQTLMLVKTRHILNSRSFFQGSITRKLMSFSGSDMKNWILRSILNMIRKN